MVEEKRAFISLKEIPEIEGLPESDKYGYKKKLRELIEEYPEILDSSKLELSKDGKHFYILLANEEKDTVYVNGEKVNG